MMLSEWARTWAISDSALADLRSRLLSLETVPAAPVRGVITEAAVQANVRLAGSRAGVRLWRNNVGAAYDARGVPMRFGLANDSAKLNDVVKSGDLIGIRPRVIQQCDVGKLIGQFISLECKSRTWKYAGTDRERAQLAWATLITSLGGEGRFISDERLL